LSQKINHKNAFHKEKNSPMKIQPLNQKTNPINASQKKNSPMENEPIEPKNQMWESISQGGIHTCKNQPLN
jgi:hypothetical protein